METETIFYEAMSEFDKDFRVEDDYSLNKDKTEIHVFKLL